MGREAVVAAVHLRHRKGDALAGLHVKQLRRAGGKAHEGTERVRADGEKAEHVRHDAKLLVNRVQGAARGVGSGFEFGNRKTGHCVISCTGEPGWLG